MAPIIDVGVTYEEHAEATTSKPVPEGDYTLKVEKVETHVSPKGNRVIDLQFSVVDDPEALNRRVFDHPAIGTFRWQQFCEATDFQWEGTSFETEEVYGLECAAHVTVEIYEGKPVNRVGKYL